MTGTSVQKKTDRPVVISPDEIRIEVVGQRQDNDSLNAMGKTFQTWPEKIYVVNRTFMLEETDTKQEGSTEMAWYVPAPKD